MPIQKQMGTVSGMDSDLEKFDISHDESLRLSKWASAEVEHQHTATKFSAFKRIYVGNIPTINCFASTDASSTNKLSKTVRTIIVILGLRSTNVQRIPWLRSPRWMVPLTTDAQL